MPYFKHFIKGNKCIWEASNSNHPPLVLFSYNHYPLSALSFASITLAIWINWGIGVATSSTGGSAWRSSFATRALAIRLYRTTRSTSAAIAIGVTIWISIPHIFIARWWWSNSRSNNIRQQVEMNSRNSQAKKQQSQRPKLNKKSLSPKIVQ